MSYLRNGCPVLALVEPESELARTIVDAGAGVQADPADVEKLAETLKKTGGASARPPRRACTSQRPLSRGIQSRARQLTRWLQLFDGAKSLGAAYERENGYPAQTGKTDRPTSRNCHRCRPIGHQGAAGRTCRATGAGKVPYDIGYVWRYGNESHPDDVLEPDRDGRKGQAFHPSGSSMDTPSGQPPAVIEKTVGNACGCRQLRRYFPTQDTFTLIRDGMDVIESTRRQWIADTDPRYLAAKLRHVPLRLIPRYGSKYMQSLVGRPAREDRRVGTWGTRYAGIEIDLRDCDLVTVCARQWKNAVTQAQDDFRRLGLPVTQVRYENLVKNPTFELSRLATWSGLSAAQTRLEAGGQRIVPDHQGKGRRFTPSELATVYAEAGAVLEALGYRHADMTSPEMTNHRRNNG